MNKRFTGGQEPARWMTFFGMGAGLFLLGPMARQAAAEGPASAGGGAITIVVGGQASELEQFAAQELQHYLRKLFDAEASITTAVPENSGPCFVVGTPASNLLSRQLLGSPLPPLDEQAIVLRKVKSDHASTLVISGGSDRAVFWGVYELMEHYGVRYLLHGDAFPEKPGRFHLPDLDVILTPNLPTRCWRLLNAHAMGPEAWGLEENEAFIDQLAKMKFNRIHISLWPWQSYSDYEFHGVRKTTGVSFCGYHYPITPDMIGYRLFGGMTEFENPEFVGIKSFGERHRAAQRLGRGILAHAKSRGMEAGITIQPLGFTREFMAVLPGSVVINENGHLTIGPGPNQSIDDPTLLALATTVIRSYIRDYPEADWLHIEMPEFRGWTTQAERAWNLLNREYQLDDRVTVADLREQARRRTTFVTGERAVKAVDGDIAALYFFDRVIRKQHLLHRESKEDIRLVYSDVSEELAPYVRKLLPPRGEVLVSVDYTASSVARQAALIRRIPARELPTSMIYTLADDNVGAVPQVATDSLHVLNRLLRENGWRGFYTRFWLIGDLDPTAHYLEKSAWDSRTTPKSAYRDLVEPICGAASVEPFSEALELIEAVTNHIDSEALGFAFPVPNMMLKHFREAKWRNPPVPEELRRDQEIYGQALANVREARRVSHPSGYGFLDCFVARLDFAVHYLRAVELIRQAGTAANDGRTAEAVRRLDETLKEVTASLQDLVRAARDNSDRGTIAILNQYGYRFVLDARQSLLAGKPVTAGLPASN